MHVVDLDEDAEREVQCTTSVLREAELDAQCALSVWLVMNETRSARRQFWSCRTRRAVHVVGVVDGDRTGSAVRLVGLGLRGRAERAVRDVGLELELR